MIGAHSGTNRELVPPPATAKRTAMTKRRPIGNAAKEAIQQAAESINSAATANQLIFESPHAAQDLKLRAAMTDSKLQRALRWLESIGAKTRP